MVVAEEEEVGGGSWEEEVVAVVHLQEEVAVGAGVDFFLCVI